ncbi:DNA maturase B [Brevundimonas sp. S30B]|uniref:phage terminase large subunit n=1 Tax=unclassified Brevundimonas TaxID=2622653 RepID=UPI0010722C01|nr:MULTISPECIES: phage terminase large subunit [unclassified Brevundimonas]QBX36901.1 DNA maturase B [Brevundimonas sp. MF30-B]TFW04304.1 DNA maturase B [Brevundimonas sp. S30B]
MNATTPGSYADILKDNFDIFLRHLWLKVLNLPAPTRVQLDIAKFLATGPNLRIVEGYRGVGKSFLTCGYVVWKLWRNPQAKVLIVSAGEAAAIKNANLVRSIIYHPEGDGLWGELRSRDGQRTSVLSFDVGPAEPDRQPSVFCVGIGGQLPNNRADIIIADDVEIQRNSETEDQRDKLRGLTTEFGKILKPLENAEIIYLGTPQTQDSIYAGLPARGYTRRVWTARYPRPNKLDAYGDTLAPMLVADIKADPSLCDPVGLSELGGAPTDPARFNDKQLWQRELDDTASNWTLHYMLDTSLSDAERYPLKCSDLIVMDVDQTRAPVALAYGSSSNLQLDDLTCHGFPGDRFYRPFNVSETWATFTGSAMHIDPSGSGRDETAYVVTKFLEGRIYVTRWGGLKDGTEGDALEQVAAIAKAEKVSVVVTEDNWGDGMYRKLLTPILARNHPCILEGVKVRGMKEKRIIGALEPVMKQHRLIFDINVIREDSKADAVNRGIFQMTHMTEARGALKHDDRIDVLALAVDYWKTQMDADVEKAEAKHRERNRRSPLGHSPHLLNTRGRAQGRRMA